MSLIFFTLLTCIIALIGGFLGKRLHLPAPFLIGSLFMVAIYNCLTLEATLPPYSKTITQLLAGIFVGTRITRNDLGLLRQTIKPALFNVLSLICFSLFLAIILAKTADIDFITAAFSTAPGGITNMSLIAMDLNADTSVVSILQLVRLLSVLGIFPFIIQSVLRHRGTMTSSLIKETSSMAVTEPLHTKKPNKKRLVNLLLTLFVGSICGFTGFFLNIPAGTMMFSLLGTLVFHLITERGYLPTPIKYTTQLLTGGLIGQTITIAALSGLSRALFPAFIIVIGFILITLVLGSILSKATDLDLATALFACAPGGATDLALISEDFGAHPATVSIIQLPRVIGVIFLYPIAVQFLLPFIN